MISLALHRAGASETLLHSTQWPNLFLLPFTLLKVLPLHLPARVTTPCPVAGQADRGDGVRDPGLEADEEGCRSDQGNRAD